MKRSIAAEVGEKGIAAARPFLSWCMIVRNTEKTLEATLKSLRERTPRAEIVIVDTCSSDRTVEIAKKYADVFEVYKGPRGDWDSSMLAFDDAAAARNFSFSLASGSWIGWIDSDDVLPGPEEAEKLLKENGRWRPGKEAKMNGVDSSTPITLEAALQAIHEGHPDVGAIWAPYLYRRNSDGTAAEWQERERFVRNDGSYKWQGAGHEILAPVDPNRAPRIASFASLLFVHMKEWNAGDLQFSVGRHYNALIQQYDNGDRSARTCLYLENFSRGICPWRRGEFLKEAYEHSYTRLDRMRSLIRAGEYAAENGFFLDALEAFAGAQAIRPDLPDPWVHGAAALERAEDWVRAAEWYEKAISLPPNMIEGLVNPRDLIIGFRYRASECWRRAMQDQIRARDESGAKTAAAHRLALISAAAKSDAAGPDKDGLTGLANFAENDAAALDRLDDIRRLHDWLVRNEETEKAARLVDLIPHVLEDHPGVLDLRAWADRVKRHLSDRTAYKEFYNSPEAGAKFIEDPFDPRVQVARVKFLIDWIRENKPGARVLEIGCFDGSVGIPLLRACPDVTYVGVDVMKEALSRFQERAEKEGLAGRLQLQEGFEYDGPCLFDVIVFYEIIEHVPDTKGALRDLFARLRMGGVIFVSTPWGACDRGHPSIAPDRDPRGHVRAMTAWELYSDTSEKYRILEMDGANQVAFPGIHLVAEIAHASRRPISFCVASALWQWNASHVLATGIGASEETIVYLARRLAKDPRREIRVFGPVPTSGANASEEVKDSVGYFTREKVNRSTGTIVVSRSPGSGRRIDPEGKRDKILWLQDTIYPDLCEDTARDYRKIVVLTEWHKAITEHVVKSESHRLTVIPNFLLKDQFRKEGAPKREPHHFVYASSPDRGLIRLLKIWPKIKKALPDATLDIFYGWEGCMKLGAEDNPQWMKHYRDARTAYMELRWQPGITERGRVNHEVLAREFQRASAWLYPTAFAETGCLTAAKVRAAGCVPVTTRYAGLSETGECPQTRWVDMPGVGTVEDPTADPDAFEDYAARFVESVVSAVELPESSRIIMSEEAISQYDLEVILPKWLEVLEG